MELRTYTEATQWISRTIANMTIDTWCKMQL